jgi:transposase-like protein
MEPEIAILDDAETPPLCPSCGQPMRFVRAMPRFAALPELRTYQCDACGETYTEAVEPGEDNDLAWIERPRDCGAK